MRWIVGLSFVAMAAWLLVPDHADDAAAKLTARFGVFATTLVAVVLAEMGDKTQIATLALAARYAQLWAFVTGSPPGMLLANLPAVLIGRRAAARVPLRWVHRVATALFALLGVLVLFAGGVSA